MGLSNDLISQFVKVTKDEQKTNKESIVYGTIQEDTRYVKIDGSDILTPVSTTTVLGKGDRVTVMIKNHTATVTGNLTSPSARVIDTVTVDEILATYAEIDKLIAADVEIQNTLKAEYLTAGQIESDYAKIKDIESKYITTEKLEAEYAKISTLEADYVKISTLEADYATIANLDAVKGDISTLSSDVANIDSLIFGSASGSVIQTSFANSVVAQLGDAQIKSAMIESVSASKILAGDIITNNVHVKSNDGRLLISDETISISDDTRVRVQIGKDKSNDYSINVWDQNGNLMFSEGGITDAAIKQAIIRDDMVSETANINASKLDISSLFREINDSSSTIKSTKIYLDEEGQTLDVSFKSLTTEVTEQGETIASQGEQLSSQGEQLSSQGETISSQGTAISTIQGQISSKIWQQDIDVATEGMETYYSVLQQNFNSFQTTVSANYATKDELIVASGFATPEEVGYIFDITDPAELPNIGEGVTKAQNTADAAQATADAAQESIDNLEIGSRNLLRDSDTVSTNSDYRIAKYNFGNESPIEGELYTLIVKGSLGSDRQCFNVYNSGGTIEFCTLSNIGNGLYSATATWKNANSSGTTTVTPSYINIYQYPKTGVTESTIEWAKLVKGSKICDWTPAPEDIESDITNLDARIISAESSITQLSNKITANVTETTNLGTRMTTIEQTAEDLSVEIDELTFGGRNLILNSDRIINNNSYKMAVYTPSSPLTAEEKYTVSMCVTPSEGVSYYEAYVSSGYTVLFELWPTGTNKQIISKTFTMKYNNGRTPDDDASHADIIIYRFPNDGTVTTNSIVHWIKVEKGDKATDWTPAPEDVERNILNASKTATNYLNFSSSGLVIGDLTADTLGKNVLIDSDSVDVRNGDTTLASFGADYLYLAKNSRDAKIDLCNGLAQMYHEIDDKGYSLFNIDTTYALSYIKMSAPMHDLLVLENTATTNGVIIKGMIHGETVGGFGLVRDGHMVRYGSDADEDNPIEYRIHDEENFGTIDEEWHYGGVLGENFTIYSNDDQIQYRKIGKIVQIRGTVRPTTNITGSSDNHTIFTLPEGYRPSKIVNVRCQGSGAYSWLLSITTGGLVRFSRYNNGANYVNTSTTSWLPFNVTFFID